MNYSNFFILTLSTLLSAQLLQAQYHQAVELGKVNWLRDYDEAITTAEKEQKQILLLFQEVPGCATCRNYGNNVLSHPLLVEAIENLFIPLAIFNNKGGKDRAILQQFNEPSWNNPVVRIINTRGKNVVPRIGGDYSAVTLCRSMISALKLSGVPVPEYLTLLETELAAAHSGNIGEKHFKMYCFWTGEKELGKIDGVLDTESGFMKSSEVVKVRFDREVVDEQMLIKQARKNNFEPLEAGQFRRSAKDVHFYLRRSLYQYLPLTELQQTRINSLLGRGEPVEQLLSPQQRKWLDELKISKKGQVPLIDIAFREAWTSKAGY